MIQTIDFDFSNVQHYDNHKYLKKLIFNDELEWNLPIDPNNETLVVEDDNDPKSLFVNAYREDNIISTIRVTNLKESFPHRDIFPCEYHKYLSQFPNQCWTFNGLMVVREERKKIIQLEDGVNTSISRHMLDTAIKLILRNNGKLIWATISNNKIRNLALKYKFIKIGDSFKIEGVKYDLENFILILN